MRVEFRCRYCGRRLSADSHSAGARLRCPACRHLIEVPPAKPPTAPFVPASSAELPEPIRFPKPPQPDDRIDMTPMIDCVFLLLIFYVVSATFAYQKALEMPPPETDAAAPAKRLEEVLESDECVVIRVDRESVLWVNESEVRTRQDLLAKLRAALEKGNSRTGRRLTWLMVLADPEARHDAVVMALDAGNAVGIEQIRLATVPEEEF